MNRAMLKLGSVLAALLIVIVTFGVLIGKVYALYVLPPFYFGATGVSYVPWVVGIPIAAMIGGFIGYLALDGKQSLTRVRVAIVVAVTVACSVFYLSLILALSTRGT